ncbi:MFS transporter [Pseudoduganella flava]|uniref:MFS transporter n=1 Tax=Pseudoduganella flava TaxID=871742 RepID=A0A562PK12_9BURK|nr:MFS transporter [Pseudoduganella flava]QGZ42224.1 MFS transporter [Pseudoduganella flava]TWI44759.1 MFS transporter [Pseudoduganella flava]
MSAPQATRAALWAEPNFRWLLGGGMLSMIGDQFTLIALPWLVLKLTGDPLALGVVIALMSIPRAVFILVGGALVDRYSPLRVMMLSKHASALLLFALAALTLSGSATLPLVYALALGIGLAQAFAIPSGTAMLPQTVPAPLLQAANGTMMGMRQLSMLAGPLLAALLLALAGGGATVTDARPLGLAFAVDCASFVISAFTLARVRPLADAPRAAETHVLRAVGAGLAMVWRDTALRTCFLYWGLVAFCVGGAMQVALPLLARDVLHGASSLGVLMGAHGAGTLLGMVLAARAPRLGLPFGAMLLLGDALAGLLLVPLGAVGALWQAILLLLALGVLAGYLQVAIFTWIGRRVAPQMLGRAMSIFLFIFMGLAPLSAAFTGAILQYVSLATLYAAGGALLTGCAAFAWLFTPMRTITAAGRYNAPSRE